MRVTIVPIDGTVVVDGQGIGGLDLSRFDPEVHAITWNGTSGEVQIKDEFNRIVLNQPIDSLEPFQWALDLWQQKMDERNAPPPPPTPEQIKQMIVDAVQRRLDEFAQTRNYDNILSACTYATSTVQQFRIEGQYCVDARDATWAKLYEILVQVQAGQRPVPTGYADIEAELPVLEWPAI